MVWWPRTVISARWRWRQEQKSKAILGHTVSSRPAWAFPNFPSPPAEALLKNSRREENSSMARVGARVLEPQLNYKHLHVLICKVMALL